MRVVAATSNRGKLAELRALLDGSNLEWEITPQSEFGFEDADETAPTFVENALIKARNACAHTGLAAIADDSGLEVDALGGAPGVRSARYAGDGASDADNVAKLLRELDAVAPNAADRAARFRCALVFLRGATDPSPLISTAAWEGRILDAPRGDNGFGYDPVFWVAQCNRSAAQLDAALKNRLSHRGQALRQLRAML